MPEIAPPYRLGLSCTDDVADDAAHGFPRRAGDACRLWWRIGSRPGGPGASQCADRGMDHTARERTACAVSHLSECDSARHRELSRVHAATVRQRNSSPVPGTLLVTWQRWGTRRDCRAVGLLRQRDSCGTHTAHARGVPQRHGVEHVGRFQRRTCPHGVHGGARSGAAGRRDLSHGSHARRSVAGRLQHGGTWRVALGAALS